MADGAIEPASPLRSILSGTAPWAKYAYFPVGGGPRQCVGTTRAMLELPMIVAMAAQRFRLEADTGEVRLYPHVSLQPHRKVAFRLHRR